MKKIYIHPRLRYINLDPTESLLSVSTDLEDTTFGGDEDGEDEAGTKHAGGIWSWDRNDN